MDASRMISVRAPPYLSSPILVNPTDPLQRSQISLQDGDLPSKARRNRCRKNVGPSSSTNQKMTRSSIDSVKIQADILRTHLSGTPLGHAPDGGGWSAISIEGPWKDATASPLRHKARKRLLLAIQGMLKGMINHWSLVVAPEGQRGDVYQVKGDPHVMTYMPVASANILSSVSLKRTVVLNPAITDQMHTRIEEIAGSEEPPEVGFQSRVTENCQSWVLRVVARLVQEQIVRQAKFDEIRLLRQPIKL